MPADCCNLLDLWVCRECDHGQVFASVTQFLNLGKPLSVPSDCCNLLDLWVCRECDLSVTVLGSRQSRVSHRSNFLGLVSRVACFVSCLASPASCVVSSVSFGSCTGLVFFPTSLCGVLTFGAVPPLLLLLLLLLLLPVLLRVFLFTPSSSSCSSCRMHHITITHITHHITHMTRCHASNHITHMTYHHAHDAASHHAHDVPSRT